MRMSSRVLAVATLLSGALVLQGCLAVAATGAVVGTTGAVVKGTVKGGAAVGRAVIPGDSRKDRDKD